jgi:hypothetical protein
MTTLGKTTTGTTTTSSSGNKTVVSPATASASGTLATGQFRVLITSGTGDLNLVVYADSGGSPGALLAVSDTLTISNTTMAWNVFTFSGANQISITNATTYQVGASWADPGAASFTYERDNTASQRNEQTTHNPSPFGTPSLTSGGPVAAYVVFNSSANPSAGLASGTGAAYNATATSTANTANAGHASGTGAAYNPAATSQAAVGTPILQNVTSGVRLALEVAWGADLTDLTGAGWTWTDITADVQLSQGYGINLQMGAADESTQTQPAQLTVVLDNSDGGYSLGPQSNNYPNVTRNVPVRLRVSTDSGGVWTTHYQGNAVGFTPNWDTSGQWATVTLTASGWLRQINQGTLPVTSAYTYWTLANQDSHLIGYWPLEDGAYATTAASGIGGTAATVIPDGFTALGASNEGGSLFACAATMPNGGNFTGTIPSYSNSGVQQIMWLAAPSGSVLNSATLMIVGTASGSIRTWELAIAVAGGGDIRVIGWSGVNRTGALVYDSGTVGGAGFANVRYLTSFTITTSGSDVIINFEIQQPDGTGYLHFQHTITGQSSGDISYVSILAPDDGKGNPAMSVGHITFRNSSTALSTYNTATSAYSGESVTNRLTRLTNDAGIPLTILTDSATETSTNSADTVGPQYVDTLTNLMRECETTGLGRLYDGLNIGLTYVTRLLRESQQPKMTVDVAQGAVVMPFEPVFDDQNTVNQATVQRRNGSSYTATDSTSADAVGLYTTSLTVNQADDTWLKLTAKWLARASSLIADAYRYPSFSFALEKQPSLIADWLTCFPSCRIDVSNIDQARSQHPTGTLRNVLEGWTETISQHQWHVTANTSSYEPWKVITLADATGSTEDTVGRYEPDSDTSSTVNTSAAVGATSLSVAFTGTRWVTTADTGGSDNFPLTVAINGWPVTVTNITGTTSPQTFTVSALTHAVAAGDPITIYQNAVLGM